METKLLFFDSPSLFYNCSYIIEAGNDDNGFYIVPAETSYFPGGGGQEADLGKVLIHDISYTIKSAKIVDNRLTIYLAELQSAPQSGTEVMIQIDPRTRTINSRLHSAGHLISSVIFEEMKLDLIPVKGYHYSVGSHVEFASQSGLKSLDIDEVNNLLQQNIEAKKPVVSSIVKASSEAYLNSFKIPGFSPHENADIRLVKIGDFLSYACGGTHVVDTGELNGLKVKRGLNQKKGTFG